MKKEKVINKRKVRREEKTYLFRIADKRRQGIEGVSAKVCQSEKVAVGQALGARNAWPTLELRGFAVTLGPSRPAGAFIIAEQAGSIPSATAAMLRSLHAPSTLQLACYPRLLLFNGNQEQS